MSLVAAVLPWAPAPASSVQCRPGFARDILSALKARLVALCFFVWALGKGVSGDGIPHPGAVQRLRGCPGEERMVDGSAVHDAAILVLLGAEPVAAHAVVFCAASLLHGCRANLLQHLARCKSRQRLWALHCRGRACV